MRSDVQWLQRCGYTEKMTDPWNPAQYERFKAERVQPFFDLLAWVDRRSHMRILDLGCGTGELTAELHRSLAARETLGIDRSPQMLARSAAFAAEGLGFEAADMTAYEPNGSFDLIFSNAALHWLPDHPAFLRRIAGFLAPGGQLAVQIPANDDHPSHLTARAVAAEEPFRSVLESTTSTRSVLAPERYAKLLYELGFRPPQVRLQVYVHPLPSRESVAAWAEGSVLTEYAERLGLDLYADFRRRYRAHLLRQLEDTRPYPYTYKRIFFQGTLPT